MEQKEHNNSDAVLVDKAKEGDTEALSQLILRYLPAMRQLAARCSQNQADRDDYIQEGLIGLVYAVQSYNTARNASFKTYCMMCARSKIQNQVARQHNNKHLALQNYLPLEELDFSKGNACPQGDPYSIVAGQEEREFLQEQAKTLLSGLEQETLTLYLSGHSYEEMAVLLNSTTKSVDNALQRVRRKLREVQF